jgi:hypothetical protein
MSELAEDEDGAPYPPDIQELIRLARLALPYLDVAPARSASQSDYVPMPNVIAARIRAVVDAYPEGETARSTP